MDRCNGCGKIDYPSRGSARLAANRLSGREGGVATLNVYLCHHGGGWHIGNSGNGSKRKKRKKKPPRKRQPGATHPRYPK